MNKERVIYAFPGLGATHSMFRGYEFDGAELVCLDWVKPNRRESLKQYASRYLGQIDQSRPAIFLGVSFGGIVAHELAQLYKPDLLVQVSTVSESKAIPLRFKLGRFFPISATPGRLIKKMIPTIEWTFGIKSEESRTLFREMTQNVSDEFFPWAISHVAQWKGSPVFDVHTLSIHGTRDLVFPIKKPDYTIADAGHFMAVDDRETVLQIISQELETIS